MAKKISFISLIKREGLSGSVRAKVPAGLIKQIGADDGDGIQFMVNGTTIVGAYVLKGKALRLAQKEAEGQRETAAPVKKVAKTVAKPVSLGKFTKKLAPAPAIKSNGKKPKPAIKGSKRRTQVEYEVPPVSLKKKTGKFSKALRK